MANQQIRKVTVKGLCQYDKGQTVTLDNTQIPILKGYYYYIVQERDDGTTLQYKLDDGVDGVTVTFNIPDTMLEQTGTIKIYQQWGASTSDEFECTAIISLPVQERPRPVDDPVPVVGDISLYYNALGDNVWGALNIDSTPKITVNAANVSLSKVSNIKLILTDESITITKANQPIFTVSGTGASAKIYLVYPAELEGKLQLQYDYNGETVTQAISMSGTGVSSYYVKSINYCQIVSPLYSSGGTYYVSDRLKYLGLSRFIYTGPEVNVTQYPYLASNC